MTILAIGGTGQIGSLVVKELARRGAKVRVLATKPRPYGMPPGVEMVIGDVLDVDFMRGQLASVSTVFVLHSAVADELTRALLSLALIEEAGIKRTVYLSMMGADRFADSPRAAAKLAAEQTIARRGLPGTILRPNALFQNDIMQKDELVSRQTHATPVGKVGVTMIDGRDWPRSRRWRCCGGSGPSVHCRQRRSSSRGRKRSLGIALPGCGPRCSASR